MTKPELNTQTNWLIDHAHSEISFKVIHLMIAYVQGSFQRFDAIISTSGKDFSTAHINLSIETNSVSTGDAKRDEHLKQVDFFDTEQHKKITFVSGSIGKSDSNGIHDVWGELTIKGITKPVTLQAQFGGMVIDPWGNEKAGFTVTGKVNRKDWGLTWNTSMDSGGLVLSEEVIISCEMELVNANREVPKTEVETAVDEKKTV